MKGNHAWVLATLLAAMLAVAVAQGQATDTTPGPAAVAEAAEREDPPAAAKPAAKEEPTTAEATAAPAKPAAKEDRPAGSGGAQTAAAAMDPMAGDPADREEARASSRAAPRQKSGAGAEGGAARGVGDQQQAQPAAAQQQAQQPEEEDGDYDAESEEQVQAVVAKPVEQIRRKRVVNKMVKVEAPAELANKIGDISPTGACKAEIAKFCRHKRPGAKRLADCIQAAVDKEDEAQDDDEADEHTDFSDDCLEELEKFQEEVATNVNKDVPLALACKGSIEELCQGVDASQQGAVLACLRRNRDKLDQRCKIEVFKSMVAATKDLKIDPIAWRECMTDAKRLCPGVKPHDGRLQACLRNRTSELSWECKAQLFRRQLEADSDVRLSLRLMKKCMADKKRFCNDVEPGESRVKDCLEDNLVEDGFSKGCSDELVAMIQARSTNFRMDSKIREYCAEDVMRLCGEKIPRVGLIFKSENLTDQEDSIQNCLQDYRKEIRSRACSERVNRMIALTMQDIRFNHPLAEACTEDRARLCALVPPGSAGVIRCLKDRRPELSQGCAAMLFDQEITMGESIDFQFPLKQACAPEVFRFCGAVPHGHGRVIRCLQKRLEKGARFSDQCKEELQRYEEAASKDFRLNTQLAEACESTIPALCSQACGTLERKAACGGTVLQCLTERYDDIKDEDCQGEVFYFMKMEVRDYRNDVFLAEACREDVDQLCNEHVGAGQGRVVQCLHENRARLSAACRREEVKLDMMQTSNVELQPSINTACSEERAAHCADVRPGRARVLDCLVAKADKADFSEQCRQVLAGLARGRLVDWRRDYTMRDACKKDVEQTCGTALHPDDAEAEAQDGSVYRCLLSNAATISRPCAQAVGRAAASALQFYIPGSPGSDVCDADVQRYCLVNGELPTAVGAVKSCLVTRADYDRAVLANRTQILPSVLPPNFAQAFTTAASGMGMGAQPVSGGAAERGGGRRLAGQDSDSSKKEVLITRDNKARQRAAGAGPQRRARTSPPRRQPLLSKGCRNFLDVAVPADSMQELEASLASNAVLSQIAGVEAALGLQAGTLADTKKGSVAQAVTLTGWAALLGMLALAAILLGGVVYGARRLWGHRGYTMVLKHEPAAERTSPFRGVELPTGHR